MELFSLILKKDVTGVLGGYGIYTVEFHKRCTVKEFIDYVLTLGEKGYIGIYSRDPDGRFFGKPKCEYFWAELKTQMPSDYLTKHVKKAEAESGYGRADYILYLEENYI